MYPEIMVRLDTPCEASKLLIARYHEYLKKAQWTTRGTFWAQWLPI
jgi:hypothetical protein